MAKPGTVVLKFQAKLSDVCYLDMRGGGLSKPRDEWKLYVVDTTGTVFSRHLVEGQVTRWGVVRHNSKGTPATEVATTFLTRLSATRDAVEILEDNR